jgi:FeS assembly SUF system protein
MTTPIRRDDADDLKQKKIEPRSRHLPTVVDQPDPEVSEAFGGSGDAPNEIVDDETLRESIVAALRTVHDPEIPLNIYDLGLIYGFEIGTDRSVEIKMTLTAPGCPVAGQLVKEVASKVGEVSGVRRSHVQLVWDPPWTRERMSEEAMLALGLL